MSSIKFVQVKTLSILGFTKLKTKRKLNRFYLIELKANYHSKFNQGRQALTVHHYKSVTF